MRGFKHPLTALALVVALTVPWVAGWLTGAAGGWSTLLVIAASGVAVLGAAFVLTWAAETAEKDVPRAFALAVLAVIAVAPEYAVDALYAWEAGIAPGSAASEAAADLAVANMTGANRILIGLGWAGIALYAIYRAAKNPDQAVQRNEGFLADAVRLDERISIELVFLAVATLYAFWIPLNGGIDAIDAVFLVGLYVAYIWIILRGDAGEEVHLGVPGYLQGLAKPRRVAAVVAMFVFSALVILVAVKPFAKGLEALGPAIGLSSFFMIQWVAPLASESPEFIATAYLVRKARTTASFNTLISSKLNQWTLLIGTLVVVYSISLGHYDALGFSQRQAGEIWLTAAQSLFAVALLVDFEISIREAIALLGLFAAQFHPYFHTYEGLLVYSGVYIVLSAILLLVRRDHLGHVITEAREHASPEGS